MKKVIRLTESDLVRIIERVISEQTVEKVAGPYGTPPVQYYIFSSEGKFFIYGTNATNKSPILLTTNSFPLFGWVYIEFHSVP